MKKMSIIPGILFLLSAWSSQARTVWYMDEETALQPILSQSRRTRLCSELCMSGLGGTPCGDTCFDLIPTNLPVVGQNRVESSNGNSSEVPVYNATTRQNSCSVLCKNNLGYPLCGCTYEEKKPYATDFVEVCSAFCINDGYQLYGCQACELYGQYVNKSGSSSAFDTASLNLDINIAVDWNAWCKDECSNGNGGAACKCDLLP